MAKNKEKDLVRNTLLFTVGNAGAKLLMLIIVPLYTYYVSTEQMGQFDLVNTYVGLFSPLACLALHEGLYKRQGCTENRVTYFFYYCGRIRYYRLNFS